MPIISVRYKDNNRWKGKVWYKMCVVMGSSNNEV